MPLLFGRWKQQRMKVIEAIKNLHGKNKRADMDSIATRIEELNPEEVRGILEFFF